MYTRTSGLLACYVGLLALLYSPLATLGQQPLRVYVLAGQSNMQGHAHCKTLEHLRLDPATLPLYQWIIDERGQSCVYDQVRISYLSSGGTKQGALTTGFGADENKIGPELTFGIHLYQQLNQPILLIKTAWGGRSLHTDFRPPSAGPFVFREEQLRQFREQGKDIAAIQAEKDQATGVAYRDMIAHVKHVLADVRQVYPDYQPEQGFELAGFVWFQGWNDMVDGGVYPQRDQPHGYRAYSDLLAHLFDDVRRDLNAPGLPIVVGVLGVGGPVAQYSEAEKRYQTVHQNFRDAMAAPALLEKYRDHAKNVLAENYWDQELGQLQTRRERMNQQVQRQAKEQQLSPDEVKALELQTRREMFTDEEWQTLQVGVSNQAYHYLGSAKILGRLGVGLAEAMLELNNRKSQTPR